MSKRSRRMDGQLDLFAPTTGSVFVFPLARRAGVVRLTADHLTSRPPEHRATVWKDIVYNLADELRSLGLGQVNLVDEVRAFRRAIEIELDCRCAA